MKAPVVYRTSPLHLSASQVVAWVWVGRQSAPSKPATWTSDKVAAVLLGNVAPLLLYIHIEELLVELYIVRSRRRIL